MINLFVLSEIFTNSFFFIFLNIISLISVLSGIAVIVAKNPIHSVLFLIGLFFSVASYLMLLGLNFIGLSYLLVYVGAVSILFLFILMLINVRISELTTDNKNSYVLSGLIGTLVFIPTATVGLYNYLQLVEKAKQITYKNMEDIKIYSDLPITSENNINNNLSTLTETYPLGEKSPLASEAENNIIINNENTNLVKNNISLQDVSEKLNFLISNKNIDVSSNSITEKSDFFSWLKENIIFYVTSKDWQEMLGDFSHITSIGNIIYTNCLLWLIITSIILLLSMVGAILITIKR